MGYTGIKGPRTNTNGDEQASHRESASVPMKQVEALQKAPRAGCDGHEIRLHV